MAKKRGKKSKKKSTRKKTIKKKKEKIPENIKKLNSLLIENFVTLQKSITHLSEKFDFLAKQTAKLLELFETSAKTFASKVPSEFDSGREKDEKFLEKIDRLLDQNKTIAKGLTMMEERMRERLGHSSQPHPPQQPLQRLQPQPHPPQQPRQPQQQSTPATSTNPASLSNEGYMPSSLKKQEN